MIGSLGLLLFQVRIFYPKVIGSYACQPDRELVPRNICPTTYPIFTF